MTAFRLSTVRASLALAAMPAAAQPPETAQQQAGRCAGLKQEYDWLKGPKGEGVPGRDARLAQMQKALASCP